MLRVLRRDAGGEGEGAAASEAASEAARVLPPPRWPFISHADYAPPAPFVSYALPPYTTSADRRYAGLRVNSDCFELQKGSETVRFIAIEVQPSFV